MSNTMHQLSYSNDLFFKYTLSREDEGSVYARNTIIERVTGIRVKESTVLNPNLDPGIIGKKRIILDVHVKDEQNRHFNIEMQTTYKGLAEMMRFEFYGARALNDQLNSGKKYKDLKPVYQIIFIDEYAWNNRNLINQYQMRNEQGEKESYYPLILRTYIHMPAINDIVREKEIQRLNDFEQLVYLFENNGKNDILKSKERLVKVFMDKYEEMQKGRISLLLKLLKSKYHEDCSAWLLSLNDEQMEAVSSLILVCNSFQELKNQVTIMK